MTNSPASDLVVVGGGLAGLVAAVRASELGCSVTLLEAGSGEHHPCNTRLSGGVFHLAFNEIRTAPGTLRDVIARVTAGEADDAQATAFASGAGALVAWMRAHGASFISRQAEWQSHILSPPRAIVAGEDWRDRGPDVFLRQLVMAFQSCGGRIERGARARALRMEAGRCVGVEAEMAGGTRRFSAGAVLLADGGFQANLALLARYITARPEALKQRGAATGVGDGLQMAMAVGAATAGLDRFYGHLLCRDAMTTDRVWPYPELDALALAGIVVGRDGLRHLDEGVGGVALTNGIAGLADPLSMTVVFDAAIWEGPGRSARIPANPALADAGGTIWQAPSLSELARLAGVDALNLDTTVAGYNLAVASGRTSGLKPTRSADRFQPRPIVEPPFFAIPLCAGITYTMGGIRIDGSCRVLRDDGNAIPGLYAAGSTTGGLEGGTRIAYLGGLAKAGVQGLAAAEHVAAARSR